MRRVGPSISNQPHQPLKGLRSPPKANPYKKVSIWLFMDAEDAEKERLKERRRQNPVGLVGVGCVDHCLDEVCRGLRWAEQISPETYAQAIDKGVQNSLRYGAKEILAYLLSEENAPVDDISPQRLFEIDSLPLWSLAIERGWDINQRGSIYGHQQLRLLDLACEKLELVRWCLDHGAKLDDDKEDDWVYPPLLESVARRGNVEIYKFLQGLGARPGSRDLHIAAQRASVNYLQDAMGLVQYFLDELGWDVNQEIPDEWGIPLLYGIGPEYSGGDQITRFLLERGADPLFKRGGFDAFTRAEYMKNGKVLAVLEEWKEGKIPRITKS